LLCIHQDQVSVKPGLCLVPTEVEVEPSTSTSTEQPRARA
jgi:hypothetical protein